MSYGYDAVGQVLTVHHPNGKTTAYEYDLLGHKLKVNHPDAGEVTCTYDAAGNLLTKLTAELKKTISDKAAITYTYDYERLSEVLYPKNLFNRVTYTYGKPGAKYNRAGRLVLVEDASGGEAYYYGNQGEVVKTVRSVMVSQADVRTYVHAATYDSHNRVRTITYPDGEVVTYGYDAAGQVTSIRSSKQGKEETIVAQVGYDKDGHTIYTRMGNGTESTYAYDRQRERLQGMLLTANGDSIMQTQYKYDPVDNILGISNVITPKAPKKPKGFGVPGRTDGMGGPDADKDKEEKPLGGAFSHAYAYDELNRLVKASGKAKGIGYSMDMSFGLMGEPLTKVQRTDSGSVAGSYALAYEYGDADHPTAPSQIGHERYTYDANGNPTLVEDDSLNTERRMAWDEENRLMALSDNGKTSRYTYNAAGERIVKSHGYLEGVYVNGAPQGLTFHETEDYTIYPAPILSVTRRRFTKHYFIGDRRVASKIGAGIFQNAYGHGANVVTAGQKDYQMRMMQIERQREDYYRKLGTPPGVPTMKGATAEPENTHEGYNTIIKELGDHSVPDGWIQRPKRNAVPGTPPGPPVQWDKAEDPDEVQPGYGYVPADTAHHEDIFFYHSDHLGSTSYITDAKANVAQFDAYLPYGELLVDEHSSSEEMPYKFNGKELDQETGLYYYGARYMNPRTSLWYGVDQYAIEFSNIGSYVYCMGNPIILNDNDGNIPYKKAVKNNGVASKFGIRLHPIHKKLKGHGGVDLKAARGSSVHAIANGKVKKIGWDPNGYGRYIIIEHDQKYESLYAHLEKDGVRVKVKQDIKENDIIATSGNTGGSTGPHLHIEIGKGNILKTENKIDPESIGDLQLLLNSNSKTPLQGNNIKETPSHERTIMLNEVVITAPAPKPKSFVDIIVPSINSNDMKIKNIVSPQKK